MRAARLRIGRTAILSEGRTQDYDCEREQENERQRYPPEHERHVLMASVRPNSGIAREASIQSIGHARLQQLS